MGLFGNSYSKPGKGISKEEAAKRNFFDMAGRHVFDFIKLNLLFFACTFVLFAAAFLLAYPYFYNSELFGRFLNALLTQPNMVIPPLPFLPFMFMGPFIAGLTFVLRNWARQEHAFLVSDFFEHTKKNWKQGLVLSIINTVFLYAILNAALFYVKTGISLMAVLILFIVTMALWFITNFYTYTMMVTFKMSVMQIIKNSFLLVLAKLPQNLFFFVIIMAVHILLLYYLFPLWFLLMAVILIALTGFTMNYYSWHIIEKYMMPKDSGEQEKAVFMDVK
ncbi:MAG: hypothetical protein IKD21_04195 [Clostridia bacterium]|nr:hypothetical protein [Clostridia bacterium]